MTGRYAIVDAESIGLELVSSKGKDICRFGEMIKAAAQSQAPVQHPLINYPGLFFVLCMLHCEITCGRDSYLIRLNFAHREFFLNLQVLIFCASEVQQPR